MEASVKCMQAHTGGVHHAEHVRMASGRCSSMCPMLKQGSLKITQHLQGNGKDL